MLVDITTVFYCVMCDNCESLTHRCVICAIHWFFCGRYYFMWAVCWYTLCCRL